MNATKKQPFATCRSVFFSKRKIALICLLLATPQFVNAMEAETDCYAPSVVDKVSIGNEALKVEAASGNFSEIAATQDGLIATFTGSPGAYALGYSLNTSQDETTTIEISFQIEGWDEIKYLAFGWRDKANHFWHIKSTNPPQGVVIRETLNRSHIAFRLTNGWNNVPTEGLIQRMEVFVRGTPSAESRISLQEVKVVDGDFQALVSQGHELCALSRINQWWPKSKFAGENDGVRQTLQSYLQTVDRTYREDADNFMRTGQLSLSGIEPIDWPIESTTPDDVWEFSTTRYLWHSLQMSSLLISSYMETGEERYLFPARELTDQWMSANLFQESQDMRYGWYDHGTAMRLITMLQLWGVGLSEGWDVRFMSRLLNAIALHGELLASEGFYVRNMVMRHHNHGIFQDVALLLVNEYVPELVASTTWRKLALKRLREQMRHLSVQDGAFTVNTENSFGYHLGFQGLCQLVSGVLRASGKNDAPDVVDLCDGLENFTALIRYPDERGPSYGDSFRRVNNPTLASVQYDLGNEFSLLPNAGFAVATGRTDQDIPYQLTMLAPSRTVIHKHADNLSISLWAAGVEWLIDPGFYTHHYTDPFPSYARGALAHNAVVLPGQDYSLEPGVAELRAVEETAVGFKVHGYHTAYDDVTVSRIIRAKHGTGLFQFTDRAEAGQPYPALLMFHAGEGVSAVVEKSLIKLTSDFSEVSVELKLPDSTACEVLRGREETDSEIIGWSFPSFDKRVPIDTVRCEVETNRPIEWSLRIF